MNQLDDIIEDVEWRKTQLLIVKTLPFLHDFSTEHKEFLIKYSIPTIYALWEGYVQNSFQIYVRELNKLRLQRKDFCLNILAHSLDASFPQFREYPKEFEKKMVFISKLEKFIEEEFRISSIINTQSNVELEVINRICLRFNIDQLPKLPYKQQLQDLLKFRNRISHGDISFVINSENVEDFKVRIDGFITLIETLMHEIYERMLLAFHTNETYKTT
ncbi:MAE_28990/MAE_18760 family HEPN-like nuclease [Flavobacterium bizetiae]|uniref:MAE_28990/MAE_18760 family HEPN-like nuclease n=1 Tax=Flavobacterium bizetiae TaxID=2704140 RepID=UPI003757CE69